MEKLSGGGILDKFCTQFCAILEKHVDYIVVSGFVAIASGRARGTEDIDVIIKMIGKEKFAALHDELTHAGFVAMQSDNVDVLYDYLTENTSIRYTLKNQMIPQMELKFAKDALDDYQFQTRQKLPLTGLDIWFSSVNVNIAFKEELLKSDKDIEDSRHLRIVYSEIVDEKEIEKVKKMIRRHRL